MKSSKPMMGQWVIDKEGHVNVLQHNHVFVMGGLNIYRDSSNVELTRAFDLNYDPKLQTLTFIEDGQSTEAPISSFEPTKIKYFDTASGDTCTAPADRGVSDLISAAIFDLYRLIHAVKTPYRLFLYRPAYVSGCFRHLDALDELCRNGLFLLKAQFGKYQPVRHHRP